MVLNPANGKPMVVTINDRCRTRGFEIIDLTRKAAQEIGFYGQGKDHLSMDVKCFGAIVAR